jgi:hypothetical protein
MKILNPMIIYETENGQTHIEVQLNKDTLWLNLLQIAELFERDKSVISRHLKNIFESGELDKNATTGIKKLFSGLQDTFLPNT